jgi:hypothetical protein
VWILKALYCGNDTDFLKASATRALFRTNAIQPSDAKLFEMPAFNENERDVNVEIVDQLLFLDFCCSNADASPNLSSSYRFFHRHKLFFFLTSLAIFIVLFILIIVVASDH